MRTTSLVAVLAGCSFHSSAQRDATVGVDGAPVDLGVVDTGSGSGSGVDCLARWHAQTPTFGSALELGELTPAGITASDPFLTPDELTIYYVAYTTSPAVIWTATRPALDAPFGAPTPFTPADSVFGDSKLSLTADGNLFVVASGRPGGEGQLDVWLSERGSAGDAFPVPTEAHLANVNDAGNQYDPRISADGLELYYAPDTLGTQHVYVATRPNRTASFGSGALLPSINGSNAGDADPATTPDDTVLVFSSRRDLAVNNVELYYAVRADAGSDFSAPQKIPGLNTMGFEGDPEIGSTGCRVYFSSTRGSGGLSRLYQATMLP